MKIDEAPDVLLIPELPAPFAKIPPDLGCETCSLTGLFKFDSSSDAAVGWLMLPNKLLVNDDDLGVPNKLLVGAFEAAADVPKENGELTEAEVLWSPFGAPTLPKGNNGCLGGAEVL